MAQYHLQQQYVLRSVDFAYEKCTLVNSNNEEQRRTVKKLWDNTAIIMTDSVKKNLLIEKKNGIAAGLGSSHIPLHFLCKDHTLEALDRLNINALASLEGSFKFREALESINPGVKSLLKGEKLVVLCAMKPILNFVSHDKSSSTNQAELFDCPPERKQIQGLIIVPRTTLYQTWLLLCLNT